MSNDYINELNKVGAEITHTLGSVAHQYGPQTLDLVLSVKRIQGLEGVLGGVVAFLIGLVVSVVLSKQHFYKDSDGIYNATILLWGLPSLLGVMSLANLTYVWNWVAIFYPQIAIAHDIIYKLIGSV